MSRFREPMHYRILDLNNKTVHNLWRNKWTFIQKQPGERQPSLRFFRKNPRQRAAGTFMSVGTSPFRPLSSLFHFYWQSAAVKNEKQHILGNNKGDSRFLKPYPKFQFHFGLLHLPHPLIPFAGPRVRFCIPQSVLEFLIQFFPPSQVVKKKKKMPRGEKGLKSNCKATRQSDRTRLHTVPATRSLRGFSESIKLCRRPRLEEKDKAQEEKLEFHRRRRNRQRKTSCPR